MKQFNISRFCRLCRLRYSENRRKLWLAALLSLLALLALRACCALGIFVQGDLAYRLSRIDRGSIILGMLALVYVHQLFADSVGRREVGIHFFTLPATNLERYVSLVVEPILCFVVLWTAAWAGSELIWRLTLRSMLPDIYAIYFGVSQTGQHLGVLFAIGFIFFSGIFLPMQFYAFRKIGLLLSVIVSFGACFIPLIMFKTMSAMIPLSGSMVAMIWGGFMLILSSALLVVGYGWFKDYEVDLKVEEK